ncbi:MAG: cupin domain-containing protein [Nitrincola lacisaponensis]|uniref:cupin domain-containing protein n=1 Tax=Nitrincola lacisaponensis TaxID=267850 RepID=UPI00391B89C8
MTVATLKLLNQPDVQPETYYLAEEKLISGNPLQTLWMHYSDAHEVFFSGLWKSEPGKWRVHYTEEEYCCIREGISIVTDSAGHATTLKAGDEFVIPRGFQGTWEVVETTLKRFVVYEPGTQV